jgi:hypothetical protein
MTIDFYRWDNVTTNTLLYPKLLHSTLPHSHSIILSYRNVLNFQRTHTGVRSDQKPLLSAIPNSVEPFDHY